MRIIEGCLIVCLLWIVAIVSVSFAQSGLSGTLRGTVITEKGQPLPGANILIVGTNNGASSDLDGKFFVTDITTGIHEIRVTYIGYEEKIEKVMILPNKTIAIKVVLRSHSVKAKEVFVTAQAQGQMQAINQQLNSNTIVNVVSSARLRQNPDANAAEAIGRLPGISLIRTAGVGTGIVIRGLATKYTTVSLNGVELPTNGLAGISEYMMEKVEVFKSITADMNANSTAGNVNLTLAPAQRGMKVNGILQSGYNHQNAYWGNYSAEVSLSDRFVENRLGIRLSLNSERLDLGRQTLGASYVINSNITGGVGLEPVYLYSAQLNNILDLNQKGAATVILDYRLSHTSRILLYNFVSSSGDNTSSLQKVFIPQASVNQYNVNINNSGRSLLYSGILKGEELTKSFNLDFSLSFSQVHSYSPLAINGSFQLPNSYASQYTTNHEMTLPVDQIIDASGDSGTTQSLQQASLYTIGYNKSNSINSDLNAYVNIKIPFQMSNELGGYLKSGGEYRKTKVVANDFYASQSVATNPQFLTYAEQALPWVSASNGSMPSLAPFASGNVSNFMNGSYRYGWNMDYNKFSELWNWWNAFSDKIIKSDSVQQTVGSAARIGFTPDYYGSSINDQNIAEEYFAAYFMAVVNLWNSVTFIPGVRYENVTDAMAGNLVYNLPDMYTTAFPRDPAQAFKQSEFVLPNVHLTYKPLKWLSLRGAYTQTLQYPAFNQIMPNTYINNSIAPYVYSAGNPTLKPEQWSNYDFVFSVFNNGIGLLSVDGFYKIVKNNIWSRTYTRIPGDPTLPGFTNLEEVTTTVTLNNNHYVYVKGLEADWQTSFWYLPSPLKYFTLDANYSLIRSQATYPVQRMYTILTQIGGRLRPTVQRVDSSVTGRMLNQPNSIANVSVGFNYGGFNMWLAYQFNGSVLTSWSNEPQLIGTQNSYQRWDLQMAQRLPIKGLSLRLAITNLANEGQLSKNVGDPRPTSIQVYGWNANVGIMYNF